ncbi:MAG: pilus assembly protein [Kineosporiaceae bacterium]|nr:pilus assembly protein [Aeromicrobium sp.]
MSSRNRNDAGFTAVEFVLITPVLIVALLFTVGLGRMAHARHQVESTAADAARAASLERNTSLAAGRGKTVAEQSLGDRGLSCAVLRVAIDVSSYEPGGVVRAVVTCRTRLADVAMTGMPGTRTISATSIIPIENYRSN